MFLKYSFTASKLILLNYKYFCTIKSSTKVLF
nr:MAG TPA: hypothetical protein [Caudoviricetes sp.]DAN81443.1 MAG TPA: hypothetical protein [Caudoviricetes sp.]DAO68881.1 MAG TPA: hypothetical protein [Caudoviricetes sp.]DAV07403.1 MAG TPA: hypothetical protein [Caudoviricetes sp.]